MNAAVSEERQHKLIYLGVRRRDDRGGERQAGPLIARVKFAISACLILLLVFSSHTTAYAAWLTTEFEVIQGEPDYDKVNLENKLLDAPPPERIDPDPQKEAERRARMNAAAERIEANTNYEKDGLDHWTGRLESMLAIVAKLYSDAGFPEPVHLQKTDDGKKYTVYLYDYAKSRYEWVEEEKNGAKSIAPLDYARARTNDASCTDGKPGWISYNMAYLFAGRKAGQSQGDYAEYLVKEARDQFRSLAHELFHAIQYAEMKRLNLIPCDRVRYWQAVWTEGLTQAVAVYMTDTQPTWQDSVSAKNSGEEVRGEFGYAFPWPHAASFGSKDWSRDIYATNALFRYALERYGGEDSLEGLKIALKLLRAGVPKNTEDSLVKWFNKGLKEISKGNDEDNDKGMPLPIYFPEFLAHHGGSAGRYDVEEAKWLNSTFGGCEEVELKLGTSKNIVGKRRSLDNNRAECLKVKVVGLSPGQCLYVDLTVANEKLEHVDPIHLSAVRLGGETTFDWSTTEFDCYELSKSGKADKKKPYCVIKPQTGTKGKNKDISLQNKSHVRSWFTYQQKSIATSVENIYVFSNVPHEPNGQKYSTIRFERTVAVSATRMKNNGAEMECPGSGANKPTRTGALNSKPGDGYLASLPTDATAMPFLIAEAGAGLIDDGDEGLAAVFLHEYPDGADEDEIVGRSTFTFRTEKPVRFGAVGTYPAAVSGTQLIVGPGAATGEGMLVNASSKEPSGTMEVVRFDDELLHVRVRGRYCRVSNMVNGRCTSVETVEGEVIKAFGWVYDRAQTFTSIDTPVMGLYRALFDDILPNGNGLTAPANSINGGRQGPGASIGAPMPGTSSAGGSTGSVQACKCSCEELAELDARMEAFSETAQDLGDDEIPDLSNFPVNAMGCMMKCAQAYAECPE